MSAAVPAPAERPLGELVAERPEAASVLEALKLDYCCGGSQTLAAACAERNLDPATVLTLLESADRLPVAAGAGEHDLSGASIAEICEHVVSRHHEPGRKMLVRCGELVATVHRVHVSKEPQLTDLRDEFVAMRKALEEHMETEERILFPACTGLGEDTSAERLEALLGEHEGEHADVGEALARIRRLAGDYDEAAAFCNTHRGLLRALSELEADTHRHVHEENNVLFPRVRAALAESA